MGKGDFFDRLQGLTESYLTHRQRVKRRKQRKKNLVLDWLEAFLWAVGMVLLINQYLFQAYQIPSGSMIDTLLIGDRIFVNKIIYGPELLPGLVKLPSPIRPKRNDIVIFENPSYNSRGPVFDIAQRIIYMLTVSMVDIDRDENGEPKAHFLIKRAVGMGGDRFAQVRGNMRIRFAGEDRWVDETEYNASLKLPHKISRLMDVDAYPALEAAGKAAAYREDLGLNPSAALVNAAAPAGRLRYPDIHAYETARLEVLRTAFPENSRYRTRLARDYLGWYISESRLLPLGDNRDNSRDGRYFGPVRKSKILGQGSVIYWPPGRMGLIR